MLKRLSAAFAAGRRAAASTAVTPAGVSAALPVAPTDAKTPASWALIHFGDAGTLGPQLASHRTFCRERGLRCLLLSDEIPQLCVASREVKFEFLPWPGGTALSTPGGHAAAVDHSFRRLGRILDFWQVVGCNWHSDRAEALLDLAPSWAHPVVLAAKTVRMGASQPGRHVLA